MARSHLTFVLLCPFVLFASCQLEENPVVNPNDIYRPQIWSLLKYLNSNSERIYNYNRADFVDAQKKDNDVTELTVDVDVECIRKEPEVPCATNVLTCQGSVQYNHQINSYETLSGVSCSPKLSVQIPSADETEELPTQTSSTEPVVNTQNPIELSHEVSSSNSGEQFVAVRSHAKHCLGCPFDLNVDAEGSSVLIETALKHVETERSQKQALVNVLRIQQQIVAGVKYILLIEIAPTVCSKDVQAVDLQSCPVDFSYPTEICEVTYLERPWINKNKYIVRNNCTVSQQFTTPEQKLSESNGNDLDNEIDVNGVYKKNSFPIDIKAKSEPSPNFDKIAESGQMEDVMSPARLAELESQILFKQPVMEPTVMTVPETTQQIFVVETTQNAYDFIETDPISPQIITPKSSLTDEQRGILDEFFLNDEPQQDSSSSEELSKTTNKDNSTEKIVSDESSEEEQRQKRSSSDLEKVSADEKPFVKELADFALNTLDGIDKDNLKRIVLEIQDAKKIKSYGTVYYLSILVGVSKCLENPDGDSHQLNCEENILPDSIKECKVQIQVTEEKKDPKVLKSHCQIVEKKSGARRIKRGLLGGEREIPLSDPTLNNLLQHSLTQYQSSKDGRYRILEVLSASYQIVSGKLYKIKVKIAPTNCLSNDHDSQDCQFLQDGDVKICHIRIWLQPWLPNGRQTNITCEGDDKVYSYRSKRSLHHDNHDNHDYDVDKGLFEEFVKKYNKNYESQDEYRSRFHIFRNNMKLVGQLNAYEQGTARYGATKFADLTREEFSKYLGLRQDLRNENDIPFQKAKIPDVELPVQFDWRTKNAVSEVKDQGQCGSCWAFSVTGNVEGQYAIKNGQLMEFSEQELVDCDNVDEGCNGGLMDNAYRVIEKLGGLETEQDYPYDAEDEKCHFNKTLARVQLSGAVNISSNETDMAKWLVANGPISIAINANAMQFYMGGVSHPWKSLCNPKSLDHGVLIVGYGLHKYPLFNKRLPYWIVKNSWGKSWGEQGYYRVYRGDGTCGLNQTPSSAIVE